MDIEEKDKQSQFRVRKYDFADKGLSKKEYHKKWYDANKEKLKGELKQSYDEHKDQLKEKSRSLQQKYRESHLKFLSKLSYEIKKRCRFLLNLSLI